MLEISLKKLCLADDKNLEEFCIASNSTKALPLNHNQIKVYVIVCIYRDPASAWIFFVLRCVFKKFSLVYKLLGQRRLTPSQ